MIPSDGKITDAERGNGTASNASGQGLGDTSSLSSPRDQYLDQRRRLIAELTRSHEDTEVLGPLIQELHSITKLQESFSFSDAMNFSEQAQDANGECAVHALKARLALAVQHHAGQAESLCRTPEQRSTFMGLLERQFREVQTTLVDQERQRCADRLLGLCDRLDFIAQNLANFPGRSRQTEALMGIMARSLRAYARSNLGHPSIEIDSLEPTGRQGFTGVPSISIAQFLKLLDDLSVETLCNFIDQAAA